MLASIGISCWQKSCSSIMFELFLEQDENKLLDVLVGSSTGTTVLNNTFRYQILIDSKKMVS